MARSSALTAFFATATLIACAPESEDGAHETSCQDTDAVDGTDLTVDDTTTDDTTTQDTGEPLDPDFVANGPGEGRFWETTVRTLVQDECNFGHPDTFTLTGDGFTLFESDRTYQTFKINPDDLTAGHNWWGNPFPADVGTCKYELDGSFDCDEWTLQYTFDDIVQPPGIPYELVIDAVLDYTVSAHGQFGPRNAEANGAVAWDFGMRWATDVTYELTLDCTGDDCWPPPYVSSFPCTSIVAFETASLDDPNIP